jgi:hypothetical protein
MQCSNCGTQAQEGVAFCHNCGVPISSPSLPPTVAAPQSLHTSYNSPSNDPANNPYGNPSNPYENQPTPYAPPPPPSDFPPYPQPGTAPAYGATPAYPPGYGMPVPVPVKRKSHVGLIVGIVIAVIVVGIIGAGLLSGLSNLGKSGSPSGTAVDSTATSILTNIQMASDVSSDTLRPTRLTTNFKTHSPIYVSFQYNLKNTNVSYQNPAYMQAKWYKGDTLIDTSQTIELNGGADQGKNGYGYFSAQYFHSTSNGDVEIYWCRKSGCSDAKLAQYTAFTVS